MANGQEAYKYKFLGGLELNNKVISDSRCAKLIFYAGLKLLNETPEAASALYEFNLSRSVKPNVPTMQRGGYIWTPHLSKTIGGNGADLSFILTRTFPEDPYGWKFVEGVHATLSLHLLKGHINYGRSEYFKIFPQETINYEKGSDNVKKLQCARDFFNKFRTNQNHNNEL